MANPTGANQTLTKVFDEPNDALRVLGVESFSVPPSADAFTVELANGDLDVVYKFREGGVGGTVVATITLTYATTQTLTLVSGTFA